MKQIVRSTKALLAAMCCLVSIPLGAFAAESGESAQDTLKAVPSPAVQGQELQTIERSELPPTNMTIHAAPAGSKIYAVPVFMSGRPGWVTLLDDKQKSLPHVSLIVNGQAQDSDNNGVVSFKVPNSGALCLVLQGTDKKEIYRIDYALAGSGLLVMNGAAGIVKQLLPNVSALRNPTIFYAPAVLEPAAPVLVLGINIGASENSKFVLEGQQIPLLSSSSVAVLGTVPDQVPLGPIKQLYLTGVDGLSSNVMEVDVGRSEVSFDKESSSGVREIDARVALYGSNLPALVEVVNDQPSVASLGIAGAATLGEFSCLLLPGGDPNILPARLHYREEGKAEFHSNLQPDFPLLSATCYPSKSGSNATSAPESVWRALYKAQLIKLKRRLVSVQSRLANTRDELEKLNGDSPSNQVAGVERLTTALKALALRQDAISVAINSRRCLFESVGGTVADFQNAMDIATGGSMHALESSDRVSGVLPSDPVVSTSAPSFQRSSMNRRLLRALAEPRMKLLPPLDMDTFPQGQAPLPGATKDTSVTNIEPNHDAVKDRSELSRIAPTSSSAPKAPNPVSKPKTEPKEKTKVPTAKLGKDSLKQKIQKKESSQAVHEHRGRHRRGEAKRRSDQAPVEPARTKHAKHKRHSRR